MRVLVVEDETLSALSLTAELEQTGHSVVGPARSSGEAVVLARTYSPNVALVDINLERVGAGIPLARQLSAELHIPVIFMTEHKTPARENATCALGMIAKPFDSASVPDILRFVDERRRGGARTEWPNSLSFESFEPERGSA